MEWSNDSAADEALTKRICRKEDAMKDVRMYTQVHAYWSMYHCIVLLYCIASVPICMCTYAYKLCMHV